MQGLVSVYVREPALGLAAGDRVRITGDLRTVSPAANPGSIDWRLVNRRNGILVQMSCPRAADVQIVHPGASWWMSKLHRLRCRARAALLEDTFSGDVPGSGFLAAMVLGQRSAIDPALNEAFVRSGTVHYLSVSGAHVGMMVGAIWGLGFLCGLTRRQCAAWAMIAATAYAIAAEPSPPIFRAAIMTDLGCLALLVRRPVRIANSLALSVLIILAVQPTQLFNAGFQLSYLTLLSVIYAAPRLHATVLARWRQITRRDDPLLSPEIQRRIGMAQRRPWLDGGLHLLGWSLAIGAAAWVVGALLSAYHFQQLQMWGGLNSIVLVPLVWWVMVVGLVKTALGVVLPGPAGMLGGVLAIATRGLIRLVEAMAQLPGSGLPTPMLPTWVVVGCLLVVLLWIVRERLRLNDHAVRCSMLIAVIALAWTVAPRRAGDALQLHVLSVGNGTATVIELPNGKTLLYDIGSFPPFDLDRWAVGPLLARDRCPRVDAVVLSHANVDHYGGLFDLLNRREVACVITTPHLEHAATSATSRHLLEALDRRPLRRLHVDAGTRLSGTGSAAVEVLWPPKGELTPADTNDSSIVLRVSFAGTRILLCGDIEERAIESLLASTDLRADILLLPHHGSVVPGTPAFIRAVAPRCCIRSTGRRDTSEPLLQAVGGCQYFSTAQSGAVSVCVTAHDTIIQPCLPDARR